MSSGAVVRTEGRLGTTGLATLGRLDRFFSPRSLAVVGASETSYWGRNVFSNLSMLGFAGRLVPVNPKRKTVFGIDCIPSLRSLSAPVDLTYIAAPTDAVPSILDDAAAAGIKNAVIIAAGFGESGAHGSMRQASLSDQAARNGITILGPNCPGFINMADRVSAYGQEIPSELFSGKVGIVLQSGALTTVVLKFASAHGIGVSKVVCMGNEAVVRSVDVLEHMIEDKGTSVIAMFLEQIRDGSRFLDVAHRALRTGKPIVVLKVGRTPAGQKTALAHTGAIVGDEAVVDAALRQAGVVRVRSLEELLITAGLMSRASRLKGARVAVVTASGGACDIIADRASDEGLEMPPFSPATKAELETYLPSFATVQNPLDTAAVDTARETGTAAVPMDVVAEIVSRDPTFDLILYMGFNVIPQVNPAESERNKAIARMAHVGEMIRKAPRPIVPITLSCMQLGPFAREQFNANDIFILGGIEFGLTALGHAVRWEALRSNAAPTNLTMKSTVLPATVKIQKGPWSEADGREFLEANGVPLVPASLVHSADEAATAAKRFGFPVVLKICAAEIPHKSDIGGVALNLRTEDEVRTAYTAVRKAGESAAKIGIEGVLVCPMRPRGVELFAGVTVDPCFGPTLAVGLGGIWIEVLKDVSLRVLPVTEQDVIGMLKSLRARPLLEGARGEAKINLTKAAQAVQRIAEASLSLGPHLQALEVNPLWCLEDRVEALDVLVVTDPGGH